MSICNVSRHTGGLRFGQAVKTQAMVRGVVLGAAFLAAFPMLRSQELSSATKADPSSLEARPSVRSIDQTAFQDYVICPDDVLDIHVFEVAEISRQYRVSPGGFITVPLLGGPLTAAGLTPVQLSRVISEKFQAAGLLTKPQVTVWVKESRIHSVVIGGAVTKPQIYPVFGRTKLLDVLSQAEGLAQDAGNTAIISRGDIATRVLGLEGRQGETSQQPPPSQTVTVDLRRLLEAGDAKLNLDVYPGDRVTVQRAGIIYVVGGVNRSGGFTLKNDREEMTVLKAVALAEDLKPTAVGAKALIIRKNPEVPGGREEIPVNLKEILARRSPDRSLLANDILFVPDSSSKKVLRRAAEAAIQATTGIIIWRR